VPLHVLVDFLVAPVPEEESAAVVGRVGGPAELGCVVRLAPCEVAVVQVEYQVDVGQGERVRVEEEYLLEFQRRQVGLVSDEVVGVEVPDGYNLDLVRVFEAEAVVSGQASDLDVGAVPAEHLYALARHSGMLS
jgi:hypothetical protein